MTQPVGPLLDVFARNYGIRRDNSANAQLAALAQPTWYVNAVTGSDTADGLTPATAIKTLHELTINRWGRGSLLQPTGGTVTVNLESSIPANDPLDLAVVLGQNAVILFKGTNGVTSIFGGTFAAVTALNRAANQAITVTDGLAPWAANLGQRVRNTTAGPRLNSIGFVAADLGAGVAKVSRPWITLVLGGAPVFLSAGAFNALDTFVIETCPQMTVANVDVQGLAGAVQNNAIKFQDIDIAGGLSGTVPIAFNLGAGVFLETYACQVPFVEIQGGTDNFFNDRYKDAVVRTSGDAGAAIFGGLSLNPLGFFAAGGVGSSTIVTFDFLVEASTLQLFGVMLFDDVQIDDSASHGLATNPALAFAFGEVIPFFGPNGALYGAGNAGAGVHLGSNASLLYTNAPTINSAGTNFECGAVGALATPDPATNTNTAAIAQLWVNLTAARPAGFGGTVINPSNLARILPFVA